MAHQDELISALIKNLKDAAINQAENPSPTNAQALAKARHNLHKFLRKGVNK